MKKTYIAPEMENVELESAQLLAGSSIVAVPEEAIIDGSDIGSRELDDLLDW